MLPFLGGWKNRTLNRNSPWHKKVFKPHELKDYNSKIGWNREENTYLKYVIWINWVARICNPGEIWNAVPLSIPTLKCYGFFPGCSKFNNSFDLDLILAFVGYTILISHRLMHKRALACFSQIDIPCLFLT